MKKDMIFAPAMLLICILLSLAETTGKIAHIAISVVGILVLIAYTVLTKKEWKNPAMEIITRVCYGLALISGVVYKIFEDVTAVGIAHRVTSGAFMALFVWLFLKKLLAAKKD